MSLNLHALVGDVLTIVNDWQNLVFTKTLLEWTVGSDTPQRRTQRLVMRGKMQPANLGELKQLGVNLTSYLYFKVFITGTPNQIDQLNQFAADTFTVGGYKYKVVATERWDDAGWREIYAYRIDTDKKNDTQSIINVSGGTDADNTVGGAVSGS
ncbi:MAG: hypothetical protein IKD78_06335 [Bacteroidales bacterium]|nr:hypothetical protein [Bacteroidales bacterium]